MGCFPTGSSCTSDESTLGKRCLAGGCKDEDPPDGLGSACMLCIFKAADGDPDEVTQAHLDSCGSGPKASGASAVGASVVAALIAFAVAAL